jgi:magnesium chelatase subunit D
MLLDSPVAHLERHAQHAAWRPRLKWLAGCQSATVGDVSRHLLDRFPIRFTAGRPAAGLSAQPVGTKAPPAPSASGEALASAALPSFPAAALTRADEYFPATASVRRVIALSRLARALARLDGATAVTVEHVDESARLMSLAALVPTEPKVPQPEARPAVPPSANQHALWQEIVDLLKSRPGYGRPPGLPDTRPTVTSPTSEVIQGASEPLALADLPAMLLSGVPYPEDAMAGTVEAPLLALPDQRPVGRREAWGPVIGTRPATGPRDLAWVPTVIEAAKFQAVRRRFRPGIGQRRGRLILSPTDLRAYRRSRRADARLLLVLDHTCLQHTDATELLASYLYWAYTRKAAVTLIEVGAAGTTPGSELRARSVTGRSVQDPAIQAALRRPRGKATPLAHGLEFARYALWRASRAQVVEAWLVVVTDGLGNVPLAASLAGTMRLPWAGHGIDDAVAAASALAAFKSVNAVVIAPPRVPHPELPARLAAAMGAGLIRGTPALPVLTIGASHEVAHAT